MEHAANLERLGLDLMFLEGEHTPPKRDTFVLPNKKPKTGFADPTGSYMTRHILSNTEGMVYHVGTTF